MKKKLVSVLLCVAMAVSMVVGCGSSKENSQESDVQGEGASGETEVLEVWLPPLDDDTVNIWGGLLETWESEHNAQVNVTIIPWENYEATYTTALNVGEGPDVGYMYNEMFPTYIEAGAVTDMSGYVTEEDQAEYKYLKNGTMMDGQYGWPIVTGVPFVLYYNQDILDDLGEEAPQTWEDFERIAAAATKDTDGDGTVDQYGFACGLNTSQIGAVQILNAYYYGALWQNGGEIYNDDYKTVSFANEAGVEAMTWLKGLTQYMNPDFMSLTYDEAAANVFAEGDAAFAIFRSSQVDETLFKTAFPNLGNWDYVTSLEKVQFGTFGATDNLTLMSAAENQELAMEFIKYVTGSEFMTQYHASCPGATLTVSEPYAGDAKMERIYTDDKDKWRGLQVGPCGTEILTQLAADFQGIMSGELSVEEGLKEAEDFANGLLSE